jgi:hypothetical protein
MIKEDDINNEFCCECGISFKKVQKCGPIIKFQVRTIPEFFPMACAFCFTIHKIEHDLALLKIFVNDLKRRDED